MTKLECVNGDAGKCPQGELLRVRGEGLQRADSVMFLGRRGSEDDKVARTDKRSRHRVIVRVPADATTGPVRIKSKGAATSLPSRRLRVVASAAALSAQLPPVVPAGEGVFPVRGKYDLGTEINRFGGGRGHKGQDVFAACGTPIVSARSGTVSFAKFQERAGNYVVITADDGTSQAYMHMLAPAIVQRPQRVTAGQPIGQIGQTGRATGCHLHFELWTAPGWYQGGQPIDPLPELQRYATRG
ncbi:MAG: M23 family metallopeptidase [Solirubrobacteraceae bacterium]